MIHEPEFVRGNQNNYIRIVCSEEIFNGYEYQMYKHNELKSTPHFQQRNQNGENYLYYEVGGMQSLDVFLQSQKLKRDFAVVVKDLEMKRLPWIMQRMEYTELSVITRILMRRKAGASE